MNNHRKSIVEGIASDSIIFVLTILINFAVIPIYLNFISLEVYGTYLAIQGIIVVFSLADIGMPMYSLKKMSSDDFFNSNELGLFLSSAQIFQYLLAIVLLVFGVFSSFYINEILDLDVKYINVGQELFLLFWLSVILGIIFGLNHSILRSRHMLKYMNISIFMILLLSSSFNILFLYFDFGLISFGISILLSTFVVNIFITIKVYKTYRINLFISKKFYKKYIQEGWSYIKKFQILRIAQVSKTSFFTVLLSHYGGQILVAQYNITNKVPGLIPSFISKIIMNIFPSLSSHFENNEKDKLVPYYKKIFKLGILTIAFCIYGLYSLNESFVFLWVGEGKFVGYEVFIYLLLNFAILTIISFSGIIIQSSGEFKNMPIIAFLEVIVFILFSFILYKFIGISGFFIGYLLSMLIGLVYSLKLINNILNINVYKWVIEDLNKILFLLVIMFSIEYLVDIFVIEIILRFLLKGCLFVIIFLIFMNKYLNINLKKSTKKGII